MVVVCLLGLVLLQLCLCCPLCQINLAKEPFNLNENLTWLNKGQILIEHRDF